MSTNDSTASGHDAIDEEMRRVCSILEAIGKNYAPDSDEGIAIRDAALAYIVVQQRDALRKQYWRLRCACGGQISEELKADLRRHGIEPNDLENEIAEGTDYGRELGNEESSRD
ncbi:MAG: hypothetical protein ABFD16_25500 [Thermoguttaceae bacterium]